MPETWEEVYSYNTEPFGFNGWFWFPNFCQHGQLLSGEGDKHTCVCLHIKLGENRLSLACYFDILLNNILITSFTQHVFSIPTEYFDNHPFRNVFENNLQLLELNWSK